jgi:MFS family permease
MAIVPMIAKILTMTYWGKYSQKLGTKNIMRVSGIVIAFIPLIWFFSGLFFEGTATIFFLVLFAEAVSGFAWAGFELTTFNYMLETVSAPKRAKAFAYFNVMFGLMILLGGLFGSLLVTIVPTTLGIHTLLIVFLISFIIRILIAFKFAGRMKEVRINRIIDEKKIFFDLVLAKPWNGALHQTASIITFAEQEINTIHVHARYAMDMLAEPVMPIIQKIVDFVDNIFEKAEPIRKSIEPKRLRKHKRQIYTELVKKYDEKGRRKDSEQYVLWDGKKKN